MIKLNLFDLGRSVSISSGLFVMLVFPFVLTLSSCGGSKEDDLDRFMRDAGKDERAKIEPLPQVANYIPMVYNEDGTLNDPFKPRKALVKSEGGLQPDMNRPREALEAFPLESLKFVGQITKQKVKFALVKAPDNSLQQVKIGHYLGQNFGIVIDIDDTEIKVKEIVQDGGSGDWVERAASINLQE